MVYELCNLPLLTASNDAAYLVTAFLLVEHNCYKKNTECCIGVWVLPQNTGELKIHVRSYNIKQSYGGLRPNTSELRPNSWDQLWL